MGVHGFRRFSRFFPRRASQFWVTFASPSSFGGFLVRAQCVMVQVLHCRHVLQSLSGLQRLVGAMPCMGLQGLLGAMRCVVSLTLQGCAMHCMGLTDSHIRSVICREKSVGGSGCSLDRSIVWQQDTDPLGNLALAPSPPLSATACGPEQPGPRKFASLHSCK